jgi:hypothetical protein
MNLTEEEKKRIRTFAFEFLNIKIDLRNKQMAKLYNIENGYELLKKQLEENEKYKEIYMKKKKVKDDNDNNIVWSGRGGCDGRMKNNSIPSYTHYLMRD